ncbi:hypothetical protein RSAG8_07940, partial [Rhizoctonia solani AG-8 WAC10335]
MGRMFRPVQSSTPFISKSRPRPGIDDYGQDRPVLIGPICTQRFLVDPIGLGSTRSTMAVQIVRGRNACIACERHSVCVKLGFEVRLGSAESQARNTGSRGRTEYLRAPLWLT